MNTHYPSPQAAFQDLFRRSTGQSVAIVLLMVFGSYGLWTLGSSLFALVTQTEATASIWPQSQPQIQSLLNTLLSAGLIATALPWLMLSTHGEWFLTRSLNRWEVFVLVRRLYLQFWVLLTLGLGLLTWWSQHWVSTSGYELSWLALGFNASLSLYLAGMAAGGAALVYRQILPLGALLVWQGIAGFFPALNPVSGAISSGLWALCVALVMWQVHRHFATESPQMLSRLEENREIPPLYQELRWRKGVRPLSPRWARLQLLTRHGQMIYQHLLLGGLVLGFTQILWSSYRQFQPGSYFNGPSLIFDVIYTVLFCAVTLVMFSPRALIHRYREYFLTRPISQGHLYLSQWSVQGAAVLGLLLMGMGIALIVGMLNPPDLPYVSEMPALLNITTLFAIGLFLWIGGDTLVFFLLAACLLTLGFSPLLQVGVLITTPSLSAMALWGLALGIRALDFLNNVYPIKRAQWAVQTLLISGLLGLITFWGTQQHPLLHFVTLAQGVEQYADERLERQKQLAQALIAPAAGYVDDRAYLDRTDWRTRLEPARWGVETPILAALLKHPQDSAAAGKMLESLLAPALESLASDYRTYRHLHSDGWNSERRAYYRQVTAFWQPQIVAQPEIDYGLQSQAAFAQDNYPEALRLAQQAVAEVERQNPGPQASAEQQQIYRSTLSVHLHKLARLQSWLFQNQQAIATYHQIEKEWGQGSAHPLGDLYQEIGQPAQALTYYLRDLSECSDGNCYSLRGRSQRLYMLLYAHRELCPSALKALNSPLYNRASLRMSHAQAVQVCAKPAPQDGTQADLKALAKQGQWAKVETELYALLRPHRLENYQLKQPSYITQNGLHSLRAQWDAERFALLLEAQYRQRGRSNTAYALYWLLHHPQPQLSAIAPWLNPAQRQQLAEVEQALVQLYDAFAQTGSGFTSRHLSRTLAMQSLVATLPPARQTPALEQAVAVLRAAERVITTTRPVGGL